MSLWQWFLNLGKDNYTYSVGDKVQHKISNWKGYIIGHSFADGINYTTVRFYTRDKMIELEVVEAEIQKI